MEKPSKEFDKRCSNSFHFFQFTVVFFNSESPQKPPQFQLADHHESSLCIFPVFQTAFPKAGEALNFATSTRAGVSSSMAVLGGTLGTTAGGICGALAGGAAGVVPRISSEIGAIFSKMAEGWGWGGVGRVSMVKF